MIKNQHLLLTETHSTISPKLWDSRALHLLQTTNCFNISYSMEKKQLLQLLTKASQNKKFVCEEADKALSTMVNSVARLPLLRKLQTYVRHSNPRVRAKAAVYTSKCVSKMEPSEIEEFGMVPLAQMAADLLSDKFPDAREAARSLVISVYEKFKEEDEEGTKQKECDRVQCTSDDKDCLINGGEEH